MRSETQPDGGSESQSWPKCGAEWRLDVDRIVARIMTRCGRNSWLDVEPVVDPKSHVDPKSGADMLLLVNCCDVKRDVARCGRQCVMWSEMWHDAGGSGGPDVDRIVARTTARCGRKSWLDVERVGDSMWTRIMVQVVG